MSTKEQVTPDQLAQRVRERDRYVGQIRRLFPNAGWREIDFMLWNMTAWPICGNSHAIKQLHDIRKACGPDSKHGWWRKVRRMAMRIDLECSQACREVTEAKRAVTPSASAAPSSIHERRKETR